MKKVKIGAGAVLVFLLICFISIKFLMPYFIPVKIIPTWGDNPPTNREKVLLSFIENKMVTREGGIKTNFKDLKNDGDITRGDSVLSESEGLMLIYYVERNNREGFDKTLNYIKEYMLLENGLISWRVDGTKKSKVSATVDDLRIIKALIMAGEQWNTTKYRALAIKIANGVYTKLKNGNYLIDFNDGKNNSDNVTLCYMDLPTLKYLTDIDFKWKYIYNQAQEVVNGGFISSEVPLYRKVYNIKNKSYDKENVDMLLNTIILLNKAEDREDISKSISWIIEKFKKDGVIYTSYNAENGKAESQIQSTSIYANLLRIAKITNNKELYNLALKRLMAYQILNKKSVIYGGYGNEKSLEVYSFDNLNALLAYRDV